LLDGSLLADRFADPALAGRVLHVEPLASDPHDDGRHVLRLRFDSGASVVYKPRSQQAEAAFAAWLDWLSAHTPGLPRMRAPKTVDQGAHGWCEFIEAGDPVSRHEWRCFLERSGALLAATYLLRGADLHHENVVPTRSAPVLIDAEVLFAPRVASDAGDAAIADIASVLLSGLLPIVIDVTPMRGREDAGLRLPVAFAPAWSVRQLLRGFRRVLATCERHKALLLAAGSPLDRFAEAPIRVVLRPTTAYASVLAELRAGSMGASDASISAALDAAASLLCAQRARQSILAAELGALRRGDVPRFTMRADSCALMADGIVVAADFGERSGMSMARARIASVDSDERVRQTAMLRVSLAAAQWRCDVYSEPEGAAPSRCAFDEPDAQREARALVTHAAELVQLIDALGSAGARGRNRHWWGLWDNGRIERLQAGLDEGIGGVVLTAAALAHVARAVPALAPADHRLASAHRILDWWRARTSIVTCVPTSWRALLARVDSLAVHAATAMASDDSARWHQCQEALATLRPFRTLIRPDAAWSHVAAALRLRSLETALAVPTQRCREALLRSASSQAALVQLATTDHGRYESTTTERMLLPPQLRGRELLARARLGGSAGGHDALLERVDCRLRATGSLATDDGLALDLLLCTAEGGAAPELYQSARRQAIRALLLAHERRGHCMPCWIDVLRPGLRNGLSGVAYSLLRAAAPTALGSRHLGESLRVPRDERALYPVEVTLAFAGSNAEIKSAK